MVFSRWLRARFDLERRWPLVALSFLPPFLDHLLALTLISPRPGLCMGLCGYGPDLAWARGPCGARVVGSGPLEI